MTYAKHLYRRNSNFGIATFVHYNLDRKHQKKTRNFSHKIILGISRHTHAWAKNFNHFQVWHLKDMKQVQSMEDIVADWSPLLVRPGRKEASLSCTCAPTVPTRATSRQRDLGWFFQSSRARCCVTQSYPISLRENYFNTQDDWSHSVTFTLQL